MKLIIKQNTILPVCLIIILSCLLLTFTNAFARMITQITPTLTVAQEYNDNYFKAEDNAFEEWITSYTLGFSVGFLNKQSQIYLEYSPEYKDYKNLDSRDGLYHNASISGNFQPTKHTTAKADIAYDGNDGNNDGDSWKHTAGLSIDSQLTKTVNATFSHYYSNSFDQQVRTGTYKENQINTAKAGITKDFGPKNRIGLNFTYESDEYENADNDEYTSYEPKAFIKYWITRRDGIEANAEYKKKDFELGADNDYDTVVGDIRYLRKINRHLDGYVKYRHYLSDRTDGDHQIYHPSVGVDWDITEDSGISIGLGVLIHQWDNDNNDSEELFIDLDAYKIFKFSPKGSLSITGSSEYDESDEDAASLGYNISYKLGFKLDYRFTQQLSSNLSGYYKLQDFQEDNINRLDNTAEIGGELSWTPLKWLQVSLNASHTHFNSDDATRDDYRENEISLFVRLIPEHPILPNKVSSRKNLENQIFK